ncbi:CapA family protein [Paenibacillus agaridevorans]|uniref:CapA family protein n=1 Tax=Paenibacillus agaridevorans TaxID=171404 RepID=UPI001BE46872|nr:CapA family protein [Paenibacillus agaridevorans]
MPLSRSESRRKMKDTRRKRQRRSLIATLIVGGGLIGGMGGWMLFGGGNEFLGDKGLLPGWISDTNKDRAEGVVDGAGNDGAPNSDNSGAKGEEGKNVDQPDATAPQQVETDAPAATTLPASGEGDGNAVSDGEAVTMSFVGDMLPGEYLYPLMKQHGFDYPYRNALLYLSEPDITAGNLELPITLGGTPIEGTPYVYKGHPEVLPSIKDAGFDVLSLANNHAMDQGAEGMLDTIRYLKEADLGYMGTGNNDKEAFEPHYVEAKGLRVAFVGLSRVIPYTELKADRHTPGIAETYETTRAVAAIKHAEENADLVVVMAHWGDDNVDKPVDYQKSNARTYIDAGADLVIGAHPHVLQGFEMYKGKWIAYSLGNFIFSAYPKGAGAETGILDASCNKKGECELKFNPMIVIQGQPTPLEGDAAATLLDRLTSISFGARLEQDGRLVAQ